MFEKTKLNVDSDLGTMFAPQKNWGSYNKNGHGVTENY
jgi:hypothetical protein